MTVVTSYCSNLFQYISGRSEICPFYPNAVKFGTKLVPIPLPAYVTLAALEALKCNIWSNFESPKTALAFQPWLPFQFIGLYTVLNPIPLFANKRLPWLFKTIPNFGFGYVSKWRHAATHSLPGNLPGSQFCTKNGLRFLHSFHFERSIMSWWPDASLDECIALPTSYPKLWRWWYELCFAFAAFLQCSHTTWIVGETLTLKESYRVMFI